MPIIRAILADRRSWLIMLFGLGLLDPMARKVAQVFMVSEWWEELTTNITDLTVTLTNLHLHMDPAH